MTFQLFQGSYGKLKKYSDITFYPIYGTDMGICSSIYPSHAFAEEYELGSKVGQRNGLSLFVDAEIFDYHHTSKIGEGIKLSVHNIQDISFLAVDGLNFSPGHVHQIGITPSLFRTTERAIERFSPFERQCYKQDEISMKISFSSYIFSFSNCFFEALLEEITTECGCWPTYYAPTDEFPMCKGSQIHCQKNIEDMIGQLNMVGYTVY